MLRGVEQSRRGRGAPGVGIALLSLTVLLVAVGAVLFFAREDFGRIFWGLPGSPGMWALGFAMAGFPITRRRPANSVGWLLMAAGVAAGVMLLGFGLGGADAARASLPVMLLSAWVFSVAALSSAVVLFPSGSPPSRWWWAQLGLLWGTGILTYFADDSGAGFVALPGWLDPIAGPAAIVFQLSVVAGFFSLLARWRISGSVERLQIKWVVYGVTLEGMTGLIVEVGIINLIPAWYLPGTVVLSVVIVAVPVTMGVAMLRHRLYDVDLIINRTLVYGALTALLVVVYFGGVVLLQRTFVALADEGSQLAVVGSTLAIAALFNPLRRRVQAFVDRRFYRKKYDAARTLQGFSAKLRHETDLDDLKKNLVAVARDTMQPEHVSLWLKESRTVERERGPINP